MAFLKERIRQAVLAGEKRNIQMLTCFSLENVLKGLQLLLLAPISPHISLYLAHISAR